jgi:hypothetical protein
MVPRPQGFVHLPFEMDGVVEHVLDSDCITLAPVWRRSRLTMVSKKVNNCDKWMDDKHTDYPPSFCFIGNLFINGRINNHPYFKGENQYSNYKDNWQPYT